MYVCQHHSLKLSHPLLPHPQGLFWGKACIHITSCHFYLGAMFPGASAKKVRNFPWPMTNPPGPEQDHVPLCRPLYLDQGLNPCCLHWKRRVLTTGSQGNFLWEDRHSIHFQCTENTSAGFPLPFFLVTKSLSCHCQWLCGLMDKASDFGSEDYRFESCHGRKDGLLFEGFPGGSSGKESTCNAGAAGNAGLIPG